MVTENFSKISRSLNHHCAYIDIYLQGAAETKCIINIVAIMKKLWSLGFTIHGGQSNLVPSNTKIWYSFYNLGFTVDSVVMTVSVTETKKKA